MIHGESRIDLARELNRRRAALALKLRMPVTGPPAAT
jgi:hypothetical protein